MKTPAGEIPRAILFGSALLARVRTARAAGIALYETGAPDLGTASAGRAAMAADESTAAANPAWMTLLYDVKRGPLSGRVQGDFSSNIIDFLGINLVWKLGSAGQ